MDSRELLKFCLEQGILLDKDVLNLFSGAKDLESVKLVIEKIKTQTNQKIITKNLFRNKERVNQIFLGLPEENQKKLSKLKIKLGLSIEISKEDGVSSTSLQETQEKHLRLIKDSSNQINKGPERVRVFQEKRLFKKVEVKDFINYFRRRFVDFRNILQDRQEFENLISINKISGERRGISIIGLVSSKRVTKNKNLLFEVEDLTGKIRVLVNYSKQDLYKKAEEVCLDSVVGFNCSGNREIVFVNDIIFPDSGLLERKKSPIDESVLFIGDLHFGSKLFLEENFSNFIDYLRGKFPNTSEVEKIKYLFIVGDVVTGVGNYPNQEKDLKIKDIEEQFIGLADFLKKIRKDINIIVSPGNHDGVRLMEPQPILDKKYAWPLYDLKNVILTENPSKVNIGAKKGFTGFDVLTYHGFSFPFYANNIPRLMLKKSMNSPEEIMKYLLKFRHLAPTHASVQYFPSEKDPLLIEDVPDIFVAAHTHKSAVSYYNNILVISTSSWEAFTPYQEKFGNIPDHCKVPMFNLKTRAVKILDFE